MYWCLLFPSILHKSVSDSQAGMLPGWREMTLERLLHKNKKAVLFQIRRWFITTWKELVCPLKRIKTVLKIVTRHILQGPPDSSAMEETRREIRCLRVWIELVHLTSVRFGLTEFGFQYTTRTCTYFGKYYVKSYKHKFPHIHLKIELLCLFSYHYI